MLFTGHSEHTIDAKHRLAIPAKYRNQWDNDRDGNAWFSVPWPTGHLRLYTENQFANLASQSEATLTPTEDLAELEAYLFGYAERIEPDSSGRITLPKLHTELGQLDSDVVIVGARTRLEVHDRTRWQENALERFKQLPELVKRVRQ